MRVGELKAALERLPEDMEVVVASASDRRSYCPAKINGTVDWSDYDHPVRCDGVYIGPA